MPTKTTGQHTPTPWRLDKVEANLVPAMSKLYKKAEAKANSAFIVQAVNSHDVMLDTLKHIENHAKTIFHAYDEEDCVIAMIRNAIDIAIKE